MAYNLIVSYDLTNAEPWLYDLMQKTIHDLGPAYQLQYSLFFVVSKFNAANSLHILKCLTNPGDRLLVAETSAVAWFGFVPESPAFQSIRVSG